MIKELSNMINMVNKSSNPLPSYAKNGDAGVDIASNEDVTIKAFSWATISTELYVAIPYGYEGQVRSRSGLAAKFGLQVLNTPGTIDSGYRGEIKVILINHNHWAYEVKKGDRIAQLVIAPVITAKIVEVEELSDSDRGEGGLGSTGK
jgi:dUTP pyrophosphatase|tara:strand:- start:634 stop:1077 length:444 start_codon:yes stop_codon:yes gene_type:complete